MVEIEPAEFERLVGDALDQIPAELASLIDNLVVLVEDDPPADDPDLLGAYEGTPITERSAASYAGFPPDVVTVFRRPILSMCGSRDEVIREVRITVVHEVAHYFGIDDERIHELGYG